ncbi:MAG: DUF1801 domain-containing protein [Chloroflexota bacterium]
MAELKTKLNKASVTKFLNGIKDETKRKDAFTISKIMQKVTKEKPKMWGSSIVGFGSYHYKGASGREGDWPLTGFSPRAQNLTLYIMPGFERYDALLKKLGKHKLGKSCLYINKLEDVDTSVLAKLIAQGVKEMRKSSKK